MTGMLHILNTWGWSAGISRPKTCLEPLLLLIYDLSYRSFLFPHPEQWNAASNSLTLSMVSSHLNARNFVPPFSLWTMNMWYHIIFSCCSEGFDQAFTVLVYLSGKAKISNQRKPGEHFPRLTSKKIPKLIIYVFILQDFYAAPMALHSSPFFSRGKGAGKQAVPTKISYNASSGLNPI